MNGGGAVAVEAATTAAFVAGWAMLTTGLAKAPSGTQDEVSAEWKRRQVGLSVAGAVMVVVATGALRYSKKLRIPMGVSIALYAAGWATLTAAMVLADPDFSSMGDAEKAGRITQALGAGLTVALGSALMSMSTSSERWQLSGRQGPPSVVQLSGGALDAAAVSAFVLGWVNVVSASALQ